MDSLYDKSFDIVKTLILSRKKFEGVYKVSQTERHVGDKVTKVRKDSKSKLGFLGKFDCELDNEEY